MAVRIAEIVSVKFFDAHYGPRGFASVNFTIAAYDASADTGLLGTGGKLFGTVSALSLEAQLQSIRRDGKTVNVILGMPGRAGRDGTTSFYADTVALSTNDLTFEIADIASTEIDASGTDGVNGIYAIPMEILVCYDLS